MENSFPELCGMKFDSNFHDLEMIVIFRKSPLLSDSLAIV